MQKAYINALYEIACKDKRVISVLSDSGTEYDELFARDLPDQCINFGIAEENQVGAAAGLAKAGKIPFVYTSGAFLAYRAFEFIRDDVCLQNRNVKIVGMGSGLSWSTLGPTHHTTEDVAVLRCLPNLTILSPASPLEATAAVQYAYEIEGPVYIKLGMGGEPEFFDDVSDISFVVPMVLRKGDDAVVLASGPIVGEVLTAVDALKSEGRSITVLDINVIKPLNSEFIMKALGPIGRAITVEEHNVINGLGSAVAEVIAENGLNSKLMRIGLNDVFGKGYGTYDQVRAANNLDANSLEVILREELSHE